MTIRPALFAAILTLACHASGAPRPGPAESGAFVIRLGNDTVAVHTFTRVGDRWEGTVLTHLPRASVTRYVATMNPDGTPALLEYTTRRADGTLAPNAPRSVTVTFVGDSAITQVQRDSVVTTRVAAARAQPFINYAYSLFALPIAMQRSSRTDSIDVGFYSGGARTLAASVARKASNRYWVYVAGHPWEVTTSSRGMVQTVDGRLTTQRFLATRQPMLDVAALAAQFAEQDAPVASLSGRDTVRATIGASGLWVDYGRPLARGRRVFGADGVLGDTIWRTGANQATHFRTSAPLTIAGKTVPAGTYTLWTVARPGAYQLIINTQTGQWGTEYDASRDLVRVPLRAATLSVPVDRFTIALEPAGTGGGVLHLRWDTMDLSVPFTSP